MSNFTLRNNSRWAIQQALNYIAKNAGIFVAGGDLSGTEALQTVVGMQGRPVSSDPPVVGQTLLYSGVSWLPQDLDVGTNRYNVKTYGAVGDGVNDDAPAVQLALDTLLADWATGTNYTTLYFPPGNYRLESTINFTANADALLNFQIQGAGRDSTFLRRVPSTEDILVFNNSGAFEIQNLTIRDMRLTNCRNAVTIDNANNCQFINCSFRNHDLYSINLQGNTGFCKIYNCWWFDGARVVNSQSLGGTVVIENSLIGENAGAIDAQGTVILKGNDWNGSNFDKLSPTGYLNMGPAAIIVKEGTRMVAVGNNFGVIEENCITADQPYGIAVFGNRVQLSGGTFMKTRELLSLNSVAVSNNMFWARFAAASNVWDISGGFPVNNCILTENEWRVQEDEGASLLFDDSLLNANNKNVVSGNVYRFV